MNEHSRRDFVKQAALGAVALAPAAAVQAQEKKPEPTAAKPKHNIRIGCRFSEYWLKSKNDEDLKFFPQVGVEYVDIELKCIKGYQEDGIFAPADLKEFVSRLDNVGLKIERANALGPMLANAHLNRPEGQKEIDNHKRIGEMLADAEIPIYGIQACQAAQHVDNHRAGWSDEQGRGGYGYPSFNVERAQAAAVKPKYEVTKDQLWKGLINIYKQVMPTVEGSKTVIAMHGNDPPLYQYLGSPQILCRYADFDRLFNEVPSKHNGITFCVGTRYESGEDVFQGIRRFGLQNKLFHVHFRNVRGTLPASGGYAEVFLDDGDLQMAQVLRTLAEVGYTGCIDYDHAMKIQGDQPVTPKQYIAFCVGYMRGLLHAM